MRSSGLERNRKLQADFFFTGRRKMTTMVILAALLERIRHLDPFSTLRIGPAVVQLKQMIENADEDRNITLKQGDDFSILMKTCFTLEDHLESYEAASAGFLDKILKRSSKKMKDDIENLYDKVLYLCEPISTPIVHVDTEEIVGMKNDQTELESALTDGTSQLTLVSICGVVGIGKTTLARKLLESEKIQQRFEVCRWVRVSDAYQTRDILQEILSGISTVTRRASRKAAMHMPEEVLAATVKGSLNGRRYLIVLDALWSADAWFNLRMVLPDDSNGSRILITTEMEDVAEQVGSRIHRMRPLTIEESWLLFRQKLTLDDSQVQIGKEIVRESNGLPLAINSLAGKLLGKPLHKWMQVLTQLRDTSSGSSVQLFDAFNSSYKKLPLRLRPCLLYLGNFPDDAEVETDTICQMWMAEGLISMEDTRYEEKTMMDVAERYINELARRNLVAIEQVVSGERRFQSCRINLPLRDFCKNKGRADEFFEVIHLGDENQQTCSTVRRAVYLDKYECTHSHLYGNADYLRSLLLFSSSQSGDGKIRPREVPNLDQFIELRVLCLYGIDFKHGKFPKGVEKLSYLRYLSFRECYLKELSSSLSKNFYLQTLDLRIRNECEMTIQSHVLGKLKRLKYLYLPANYRTHNHKKLHEGELGELEILENFDISLWDTKELKLPRLKKLAIITGGEVSEIKSILQFIESDKNLCSRSLNIRRFDFRSEKRFPVIEDVFKSSALHALRVEGRLRKLPEFDSKLPWELTEIVLNGSELAEDPMQILQQLPKLRILVLEIEAYIGKNMKCSSPGFRQLEYLQLSKLYKLEDWKVEKEEAMPKLCTLIIENCEKLRKLPDGLQFTSKLRKLEIASMPDQFVDRIQKSDGTEGKDLYKIKHVKVNGQLLIRKERQQGIAPSADIRTPEEEKRQNQVLRVPMPVPVSLHSYASSIPLFNGLNFSDWWEQIQFHLGVLDLDLALQVEKPTTITGESSADEKAFYKVWERSNRLSLMFMRMTVANNLKTTLPKIDNAKEFKEYMESHFQIAEESLAHSIHITSHQEVEKTSKRKGGKKKKKKIFHTVNDSSKSVTEKD